MVIDWHCSVTDLVEQRSEERWWKSSRTAARGSDGLLKNDENCALQQQPDSDPCRGVSLSLQNLLIPQEIQWPFNLRSNWLDFFFFSPDPCSKFIFTFGFIYLPFMPFLSRNKERTLVWYTFNPTDFAMTPKIYIWYKLIPRAYFLRWELLWKHNIPVWNSLQRYARNPVVIMLIFSINEYLLIIYWKQE